MNQRVNDESMSGGGGRRVLLKQWLREEADKNMIEGLYWLDEEKTELRIPWVHGSRHHWNYGDVELFARWARHTGRWGTEEDADARRWKANFRCALNSLRDVRELKCCRHGRGRDAYRVYKFLRQRDDVSAMNEHVCRRVRRHASSSTTAANISDAYGSDSNSDEGEVTASSSCPQFGFLSPEGTFDFMVSQPDTGGNVEHYDFTLDQINPSLGVVEPGIILLEETDIG